ncbi:MAG: aspartate carbamoyltransferase [Brevinema sp.]
MKSLISINDLNQDSLKIIFDRATKIKKEGFQKTLSNRIIASLFFEASTRTKMSFETAIMRTGAEVLNFAPEASSLKKGETLEDTIRMASSYADLIIVRHPEKNAALRAQKVSSCPVINAGDGANEHPTQTLLDLFTIQESHGSLENLTLTLAGDLRYSRTIYSLIYALKNFPKIKIILAAPPKLSLPEEFKQLISSQIIKETDTLAEALDTDYFYMTRVQKERFESPEEMHYEEDWILTLELCEKFARKNTKIMHPLPRVNEIATDLDETAYQLYFEQAKNGLYTRIALCEYLLGALDD